MLTPGIGPRFLGQIRPLVGEHCAHCDMGAKIMAMLRGVLRLLTSVGSQPSQIDDRRGSLP